MRAKKIETHPQRWREQGRQDWAFDSNRQISSAEQDDYKDNERKRKMIK